MVHATVDLEDINKDIVANFPLVGDAKLVLNQLLEELKLQSNSQGRPVNQALQDEIKSIKQTWLEQWMPKMTSNEIPIKTRIVN